LLPENVGTASVSGEFDRAQLLLKMNDTSFVAYHEEMSTYADIRGFTPGPVRRKLADLFCHKSR
jgi:hypothetical protein